MSDDEREYFLTKWHHILEMIEWVPEVEDFFKEKFGVFWEEKDIDTLNDALSQWYPLFLQEEDRKIDEKIKREEKEEIEKLYRAERASKKEKGAHCTVREIKPFQPRGYKDFSDWSELGDDFYL